MKPVIKRLSCVLLAVLWLPIQDTRSINITFPEVVQIGSGNSIVREWTCKTPQSIWFHASRGNV